MSRNVAVSTLCGAACIGLLLSAAAHPLIAPACLLFLVFKATVLDTGTRRLPEAILVALHAALVLIFCWMALLRDPQTDLLRVLLTLAAPFLLLRGMASESEFNDFLIFVVSLLLVVGSAAVATGLLPLVIAALYVFVACHALPVLATRVPDRDTGIRMRLRGRLGWWGAAPSLAAHHLALGGLILGGILYLLVPRPGGDSGFEVPDEARRLAEQRRRRDNISAGRRVTPRTGFPRDVAIGDIGRIKRDNGLVFVVDLRVEARPYDPGPDEQEMLLMRARAWHTYVPGRRRWTHAPPHPKPLPGNGLIAPGNAPLDWLFDIIGYDGKTLFMPQRARRVRSPGRVVFIDELGVVSTEERVPGYQVQAAWPVRRRKDLTVMRPDRSDARLLHVPASLRAPLLRHLPRRAANDIAFAVAAIQKYFRDERFRYTLDLPTSLPRDRDPILAFLERKEGHCELFASTACLFLRLMDIPARLAGGIRCAERIGPGRFQARYRNAHAWIEIPCRGFGFVAVDVTPADSAAVPSSSGGGTAGDERAAKDDRTGGGGGPDIDWRDPFRYGPSEQDRVFSWLSDRLSGKGVLLAIGAAMAAILLWAVCLSAVRRRRDDPFRISAPPGVPRRTLAFYARWLKACAAKGHVRLHHQTPREFLRRLPKEMQDEGRTVTADFERRRYGTSS